MEQITFRAMGCQMLAALDGDGDAARAALAQVPGWFAAWEATLSRFRDESELAALNRRAGAGWMQVSSALWGALEAALEAARESGGLVTPTLLGALERAGYDRDFAALSDVPVSAEVWQNDPADWRSIELDRRSRAVRLPRGVRLDLGGSAKGWAADTAARRLAARSPALVDAGGDIAVSGPRADGSPWPIGVADPSAPDAQLDLLLLAGGGVATSGRDVRRWRQGGAEMHHIIDPRTGAPAATDLLAVTVVAPSAQEAEMAAKAVLILGSAAGSSWLASRPRLAGLLVADGGRAAHTTTLEPYRWHAPALEGAR
jgi:thiamine biosynthesis lipoprotein